MAYRRVPSNDSKNNKWNAVLVLPNLLSGYLVEWQKRVCL